MKIRKPGRPYKHEIKRNTSVVSFRLSDEAVVNLDKICDKLKELCGVSISRSLMIEMLIAEENDLEKYRKILVKSID